MVKNQNSVNYWQLNRKRGEKACNNAWEKVTVISGIHATHGKVYE